jgi:hypothetical protein
MRRTAGERKVNRLQRQVPNSQPLRLVKPPTRSIARGVVEQANGGTGVRTDKMRGRRGLGQSTMRGIDLSTSTRANVHVPPCDGSRHNTQSQRRRL